MVGLGVALAFASTPGEEEEQARPVAPLALPVSVLAGIVLVTQVQALR